MPNRHWLGFSILGGRRSCVWGPGEGGSSGGEGFLRKGFMPHLCSTTTGLTTEGQVQGCRSANHEGDLTLQAQSDEKRSETYT